MLRIDQAFQLAVPLTYAVMVAVEQCGTGWRWPTRRGWQLIGIGFFLMLGSVNAILSAVLLPHLRGVHLLDAPRWGLGGEVIAGYLLMSLGNAFTHRSYHRYAWLWRHVHRLHHVPRRLDVAGVMYQTPFEAAINAVLFIGVTTVLGLSAAGAAIVAWIAAFYGIFQHASLRTPRWLGWLIQRPEAHCLHHHRGVHAWNYSDLPLWDLLWGTLRNPRDGGGVLGFADGDNSGIMAAGPGET